MITLQALCVCVLSHVGLWERKKTVCSVNTFTQQDKIPKCEHVHQCLVLVIISAGYNMLYSDLLVTTMLQKQEQSCQQTSCKKSQQFIKIIQF